MLMMLIWIFDLSQLEKTREFSLLPK
uniref:Uncharacterized protein n=1 Tax=Rhizophora mucronata TaxID=61149 RepID=A0A2P2R102_RHIMU